jgi:hypothetical protein
MKLKQLLTAVIFLHAFSSTRAVTPYHWECGTFTVDATDTLVYCPQISTNYIYFTITNTGTTDIYVRQIINSTNLPLGWSFNMCNPNGCWSPNVLVDTFLVPASSFITARFDFHTDTAIGTGVTSVRFDDSANPTVNGATFNLHAVSLGTGIEETMSKDSSLLLYPNPVATEFTMYDVQFTIEKVEIFNSVGEKIFQSQISNLTSQISVDVSQLLSGIYFVRVRGESQQRTGKFVKE